MARLRFGDFQREVVLRQRQISYNELTPRAVLGPDGEPLPHHPDHIRPRGVDVYRLLAPYLSVRFIAQVRAVVPLAVYLVLFQLLVLRQDISEETVIVGGLLAVILGLMLFMEGLHLGLMP
ncbi:MAG: DUF1538 family protein, partial [Alphaproteobacteria bacterium]|nr:DUF1538 family protein [Alphaproteobacteria bacterium]